jgi:hypothetical protein
MRTVAKRRKIGWKDTLQEVAPMAASSQSSRNLPEPVVMRWAAKAFLAGLALGAVAAIVAVVNG